jgi:hypothetical protein
MRRPHMAVLLALAAFALAPRLAAAPGQERSAQKQRPNRSNRLIRSCPAFHQSRAGGDGLRFELHNTCKFPVACELSWAVHCRGAAESPGTRSSHLDLAVGASDAVLASGSACGAEGWDIDDIHWTCQAVTAGPNSGHDDL